MTYTYLDLLAYLIIYSFLGWCLEVCVVAIKDRRFRNRGFVNLPFCLMYGVIMDILIILWPRLEEYGVFRIVTIFAVFAMVQSVAEFITKRVCHRMLWKYEDITPYNGHWKNLLLALAFTAGFWCAMILLHPMIYILVKVTPDVVLKVLCFVIGGAMFLDFLITFITMFVNRGNQRLNAYQQQERRSQSRINAFIYKRIWGRIEKAYPNMEDDETAGEKYVFAQGICWDKIFWVFFVSALIGDIIETLYCRVAGGVWMSRSSVLYGPFSIVWGIGAVVLTLVLSKFSKKEDRYIFIVGALLGGVYEYMCSVFTEIFLGTTFWDYSWMPLNIGGRTNVLYMCFWGILSVVWIKFIYPKMSSLIEKLPVLPGKIITWVLIVFMVCNSLLSAMAMIRYTERKAGLEAENAIEAFMDEAYGDALIERVWPNMVIKD